LTGYCPNGNPFERSSKRFLPRNVGESRQVGKNVLDKEKRYFGNSLLIFCPDVQRLQSAGLPLKKGKPLFYI
jgi:hypothetical protein